MRISIFGLGYVGAVSAGCLARDGHEVIGVDPNQTKVDLINAGTTPIIEESIGEMIADAVKAGRLRATTPSSHRGGHGCPVGPGTAGAAGRLVRSRPDVDCVVSVNDAANSSDSPE